jgi:hypothetical protein
LSKPEGFGHEASFKTITNLYKPSRDSAVAGFEADNEVAKTVPETFLFHGVSVTMGVREGLRHVPNSDMIEMKCSDGKVT